MRSDIGELSRTTTELKQLYLQVIKINTQVLSLAMKSYFLVEGFTTSPKAIALGDILISKNSSINLIDPSKKVTGRAPPAHTIYQHIQTGFSGSRTDFRNGKFGTLPTLLELCLFQKTAVFELSSLTTKNFEPSTNFLAESLKSGVLLRIDARYKFSLFMVVGIVIARATTPMKSDTVGMSDFIVATRLRKVDAALLGIDSNSYDDLDNATDLVLLDEDATSRQFDKIDTFAIQDSDCVWNIPHAYMGLFFRRESASIFNDAQIWLARLFLESKATKHACSVALAKVGRRRLQENLSHLLRTYSSDLQEQLQRENESEISCAQTVSGVGIKTSHRTNHVFVYFNIFRDSHRTRNFRSGILANI